MEDLKRFHDEWGPEKILWVYDPETEMNGVLVIDNTTFGPAKGGIEMVSTVNLADLLRSARAMTWKCAIYDVFFGGAKASIIADPKMISKERKIALVKSFAMSIRHLSPALYVAGPGLNIGEEEMAVYAMTNGSLRSCTGKPPEMNVRPGEKCNIPPEHVSTCYGVFQALIIASEYSDISLDDAKIAIEGFGKIGSELTRYLSEFGVRVVAVSDSKGCVFNPRGLEYELLRKIKIETGSVVNYEPGEALSHEEIFRIPVDVLIPASVPEVITIKNVNDVKAKLIVEAAENPLSIEAEKKLGEKGVLIIPDILANAGGTISSYLEYSGENIPGILQKIKYLIRNMIESLLDESERKGTTLRESAVELAKEKIIKKKS